MAHEMHNNSVVVGQSISIDSYDALQGTLDLKQD